MVIHTLLAAVAFDPYSFILLDLVLSCVAAIQTPLIMMSQNRQKERIVGAQKTTARTRLTACFSMLLSKNIRRACSGAADLL